MIRLLRVRNFALIDELTLELDSGLNVISGETGAGKSLIVDALALVAGARASGDAIRSGEDRAVVEAIADVPAGGITLHPIGLDDLHTQDELVLRREIASDNRNRAFINNQPATATALRTIAAQLLDIHGQHEQQTLLSPATQLRLIDQAAEASTLRDRVAGLYDQIRSLRDELEALNEQEGDLLQRQDLLEFQKNEIEDVGPQAGESERLRRQVRVLEHSERLLDVAGSAYEAIYESESSLLGRLSVLQRALESEAPHDGRLDAMVRQIEAGRASLEEASWGLREYLNQLDLDPGELQHLQSRLADLERLERKYGADLLAHLEKVRQELDSIGLGEDRKSNVIAQLEQLEREQHEVSSELSRRRHATGRELGRRVTGEVKTLAMPEAVFSIAWKTVAPPRRTGIDVAAWHLAPNRGEESAPLAAIASGGELSRTMLAVRSVLAKDGMEQTLVFDEIDAGIGGEAADRVGRKLLELAASYQVLCVTHLPQIARFADRHIRIEKRVRGGRTRTQVRILETDERVEELARMMSGKKVTPAAREHVRELLARK
jgi:DNA repair protein RecN (Recombination protein N)